MLLLDRTDRPAACVPRKEFPDDTPDSALARPEARKPKPTARAAHQGACDDAEACQMSEYARAQCRRMAMAMFNQGAIGGGETGEEGMI